MDGLFKIQRRKMFRRGRKDASKGVEPIKCNGSRYHDYYMAGYNYELLSERDTILQRIRNRMGVA